MRRGVRLSWVAGYFLWSYTWSPAETKCLSAPCALGGGGGGRRAQEGGRERPGQGKAEREGKGLGTEGAGE